jgi:DNA-binding beta-propeller fold protein YncE
VFTSRHNPGCPKETIIGGAFKMKRERFLFCVSLLFFTLIVLLAIPTSFAHDEIGSYQQIATVPIPGGLAGFDISWVDSVSGTYYLADRTATPGTGRIDIIDVETNTVTSIPGFVGAGATRELSGPDGIVVIHQRGQLGAGQGNQRNELWAGDGDSTVKVVDLQTNSIVATIPTGGSFRADELAYDPQDKIIMVANDADTPPFVTFIDAEARMVLGHLSFTQANGGLEQPVWDPQKHRFYISVPSTFSNSNGEVDEVNPKTESFTGFFQINNPAGAGPAGLALLPGQRLMTSSGVVLDANTGATITVINGVGGDEIWYNPGDNRVYFGASPMPVVDASTYQVVASLPTGNTHSVAADSENNRIFVPSRSPAPDNGVQVFTDDVEQGEHGK